MDYQKIKKALEAIRGSINPSDVVADFEALGYEFEEINSK